MSQTFYKVTNFLEDVNRFGKSFFFQAKMGGNTYLIVEFVHQAHKAIVSAAMNVAVEFFFVFDTDKRMLNLRPSTAVKSKVKSLP